MSPGTELNLKRSPLMTRSTIFVGAALLPLLVDSSSIAQQPELGRQTRPGVLQLFERAVEQAPGLAVAPAEKEAPLKKLRYPWAVAPPQTRAISFVRNMQDFSDKLDHVAEQMNREPPGILRYSMRLAQINQGLRREGTLMWFFGEPNRERKPVVYALPAVDYKQLIQRLNPISRGVFRKVNFEGEPSQSVAIDGYALFANVEDAAWLNTCRTTAGGFDRELGPLNDFLARQDMLGLLRKDAQQILLIDVFQAFQLAKGIEQRFLGSESAKTLEPFFQPFEDSPPLGMANRFERSQVESQVAAPSELLTPVGDLGARALPLLSLLSER